MKKVKKIIISAVIAGTLLSLGVCYNKNQNSNIVLASVNGENITLMDVDNIIKPDINTFKDKYGDDFENKLNDNDKQLLSYLRKSALEKIVEYKLLFNKGIELDLIPNEEYISSTLKTTIDKMIDDFGSKEAFQQYLEEAKYSEEDFNELIKKYIIQESIITELTKEVTVSEKEAKQYYEENIGNYTYGPGAYVKHILFETSKDKEALKHAKALKEKIDNNSVDFDAEFEKYYKNKSEGISPISEDLQFVQYEEPNFDTDFLEGLKKTKENSISEPIKTSFGYHILKVDKVKNQKTVTPFSDVKNTILTQLEYSKKSEKIFDIVYELKNEANIEYNDKLDID